GIVAGDGLGRLLGWQVVAPPSRFAHPDGAGLMLVAGGAALLTLTMLWLRRQGPGAARLAGLMAAMGVAGGLLFVALPGWTWVDVLNQEARSLGSGAGPAGDTGALRATLATLAGALASGWMTGRLHFKWRGWTAAARSAAGGVLMMLGVGLIPGGNDALLLGAAPAGAGSALIAFALMNMTILALTAAARVTPAAPPARH
ncbi:hypothetical protein, partial [Sandarakinorhabdus rubra]